MSDQAVFYLQSERDALLVRVAALEATVAEYRRMHERPTYSSAPGDAEHAPWTIGDTSVLRSLLRDAFERGARAAYNDHNSQDAGQGPCDPDADAYVDRILARAARGAK